MKTILVPTDFSKTAFNALKYAFAYAEKTKSKIILFHSYNNSIPGLSVPFSEIIFKEEDARKQVEQKLIKLIHSLVKSFPKVKPKYIISSGDASDNIVDFVKSNNINLVIIGTTGQGAFIRNIIGSTTADVITNVPCTVIAVPFKAKFKTINKLAFAMPVKNDDFCPFDEIVEFARQHKAEIALVHVQEFETYNAEILLKKTAVKIRKQLKYKKIIYEVIKDFTITSGLNRYLKKRKPDMLSMVTNSVKFPENVWKISWTNEMSNIISIPMIVFHKHISDEITSTVAELNNKTINNYSDVINV